MIHEFIWLFNLSSHFFLFAPNDISILFTIDKQLPVVLLRFSSKLSGIVGSVINRYTFRRIFKCISCIKESEIIEVRKLGKRLKSNRIQ